MLRYDPYGQSLDATSGAIGTVSSDDQVVNDRSGWFGAAKSWQSTAMQKEALNGVPWIQNGLNGYRTSAWKGRFGMSSNLTYSLRGNTQYANLHVNHPRMF